jgi:hypothetical protein
MDDLRAKWFLVASALVLMAGAAGAAASDADRVCDLAKRRAGLARYVVTQKPDRYGVVRVHADVDGDGRKDRITWFRSQSESAIPPDSSSVTVTLSGSGKTFALEEPRVLLAHYGAGYYVVAGTPESDPGPWEIKVLRLQTNGMKRLCTFKRPQWLEKQPGGGRTG